MKDLIQRMKAKPEHVRKRIAFGTSVGVTALIGVLWVTTMATTGAFALNGKGSDADASQPKDASIALTGTNVKSNFSQLMGAVGAVTSGSSTQPALTIIDGKTTSSFDATTTNPSATVIPF
jgi:hypothetical protein